MVLEGGHVLFGLVFNVCFKLECAAAFIIGQRNAPTVNCW